MKSAAFRMSSEFKFAIKNLQNVVTGQRIFHFSRRKIDILALKGFLDKKIVNPNYEMSKKGI